MLTFTQYWKGLFRQVPKVAKSWSEKWQWWAGIVGFSLSVMAVYAVVVNGAKDRVWNFVKSYMTPQIVAVAIILGFIALLLEAGRRFYEEQEKGAGNLGREKESLVKQLEDLVHQKRILIEDAAEAKARARVLETELSALRSRKDAFKKLVEYEIEGERIRKNLDPANRTSHDGEAFEKWKAEVAQYLRQEHSECYTDFIKEVSWTRFGEDKSPSQEQARVAEELLKRIKTYIDRLQGLEQKVSQGPIQSQFLPASKLPPGTRT
jgi:hypothetical protein